MTAPRSAAGARLPATGTTIFTIMSQLAAQHDAINLGQGFPDFGCDPRLTAAVAEAMAAGHNQYAPMTGWPALREAVADMLAARDGLRPDPQRDVTVTAGATQALHTALLAAIAPGDEVIVIEPAYDCYVPCIRMASGVPVPVRMSDDYRIDWNRVEAAVTPRTRAILVNTPHNPSGTVFADRDVDALATLATRHDLWVISDEVYEHMVYDGQRHRSPRQDARLAERTFVVASFGKTLHVTGWKVGCCIAPAALSDAFRRHHQFIVFSVATPLQAGIAHHLAQHPASWRDLAAQYQKRRDRFRAGLLDTRLRPLACAGTYFQVVDYSALGDEPDVDFARRLTTQHGVAAIPMSAFHTTVDARDAPRHVRFCFAKRDATLDAALDRLAALR